jgi:indole-3-glycerol phosphate synthase
LNFLEKIIVQKKLEVEEAKKIVPLAEMKNLVHGKRPQNNFKNAIARRGGEPLKVIAEIKRASPSKGVIAENVDPVRLASEYKKGGAAGISILTEKNFFLGSSSDLRSVRKAVPDIPILRKDFIVDEYQIYESVQIGADAVLLIVAALDENQLKKFISVAKDLGMSTLVEVHDEKELEAALASGAEIIGVNNRNLVTFEVSSTVSEELAKKIPHKIVSVSESGIKDLPGLEAASELGYHAVLIGEHFMRAEHPSAEVGRFTGAFSSQSSKIKSQS